MRMMTTTVKVTTTGRTDQLRRLSQFKRNVLLLFDDSNENGE
jgi:hypothetical protein